MSAWREWAGEHAPIPVHVAVFLAVLLVWFVLRPFVIQFSLCLVFQLSLSVSLSAFIP